MARSHTRTVPSKPPLTALAPSAVTASDSTEPVSRGPGEVVAAELVTLVPAAWDLRLRNRPAAALT